MTYTAQVKIIKTLESPRILPVNSEFTIQIQNDNISDYDDVIKEVECEIYNRYGVVAHYMVDFEITNGMDICSDLFEG